MDNAGAFATIAGVQAWCYSENFQFFMRPLVSLNSFYSIVLAVTGVLMDDLEFG